MRIAIALLLLALTGCVEAMPAHDENNRLLNQRAQAEMQSKAPPQWMPRMLFE